MTSPSAVVPTPPDPVDGRNALAALFAAAAANSMHHQILSPKTKSPRTINKSSSNDCNNAAAAAMFASLKSTSSSSPSSSAKKQESQATAINNVSGNNGAQLIASLFNSATKQHQATSSPNKSISGNKVSQCPNGRQQDVVMSQLIHEATKAQPRLKAGDAHSKKNNTVSVKSDKKDRNPSPAKLVVSVESSCRTEYIDPVDLRNLETWHDEDEAQVDESYYQELVDLGNTDGWSADEMFKYNEKRHKITSSYTEKTLGDKYTTPLPKNKSKTTIRMATRLAKEIEDKVQLEGRVTPESSDDDELFEIERARRNQLKQQKQLDQLRSLKAINSLSIHSQNGRSSKDKYHQAGDQNGSSGSSDGSSTSAIHGHKNKTGNRKSASIDHHNQSVNGRRVSNKSSSQSNSSTTPVTASLSSSPTWNDSINHHHVTKPVTSSSRNILRTCLA